MVDGEAQLDVEMQTEAMKGDTIGNSHVEMKSRSIYNLCDLHAAQLGRGVRYRYICRSYQITFCNYTVFHDDKELMHRFSFRDEHGVELLDAVGIIFIELSKLGEVLKKSVQQMTPLELWSVFFAVGNKAQYRQLLGEMSKAKEEIKVASDILASISSDPVERAHFRSRRIYQMDLDSNLLGAIEERNREIAIRLLRRNRPIEEIMEDTDLSRKEIEKIMVDN
jgi:predicted transposase/invertase (TIGR01784 family)